MSGWFVGILWNSLGVSVIALVLLCFFPLLNRHFKVRTHYYLWVIVLLFMVNPFHPKIMVPALSNSAVRIPAQVTAWVEHTDTEATAPMLTQEAEKAPSIGQTKVQNEGGWALALLPKAIPYLWLGGCLFLLMKEGIRHRRLLVSILRTGQPTENAFLTGEMERLKEKMGMKGSVSLVISPAVSAPMSTGLRRPVIILPHEMYTAGEATYILSHELIHCSRKDQLIKWLVLLTTAVNWFNPLIYAFGKITDHLCELSCDAEVLKGHDRNERFTYGMLLLTGDTPIRPMPLASGFSAGKKMVKQRLRLIMDGGAKRGGIFLIIFVLLACIGLSVSFVKADGKPVNSVSSLIPNSGSAQNGSTLLKALGIGNDELLHQVGETVDFKPVSFYWQQYTINKVTIYDSLEDAGLQTSDLEQYCLGADSNGHFKPGYKLLMVDMTEKNLLPYSNISPEDAQRCCVQSAIYRGLKTPVRISNEPTYLSASLAKQTGNEDEDGYFVKIPVGESRSFRAGWLVDISANAADNDDDGLYLNVCDWGGNNTPQWVSLGMK